MIGKNALNKLKNGTPSPVSFEALAMWVVGQGYDYVGFSGLSGHCPQLNRMEFL